MMFLSSLCLAIHTQFQISNFLGRYSTALANANAFDAKISSDAGKISSNYAGIAELSVRQALGAIEITISKSSNGAWNTNDVLVFMKGEPFLILKWNTVIDDI